MKTVYGYCLGTRSLSRYLTKALAGLVATFFVLSFSSYADETNPSRWLDKMQEAGVEQNYAGVFMFSRGDMSSSMKVLHRFHDGIEQERLTQLDGEMGEIIRNGSNVVCILPDNRVVTLEKSEGSNKIVQAFANFKPDHMHYELLLVGDDRVVNRAAKKLKVQASDGYRYSYMLWLDKQTGLLLKSQLQDADGVALERFQFTQIDFDPQISDLDMQPKDQGVVYSHETIPATKVDKTWPVKMMWQSSWRPPGFESVMSPEQPGDNIMVYSDGLATYSVFVEAAGSDMMPEGASQMGATVAYARELKWDAHKYMVTVVGEIPPMTAMKVAKGVVPEMMQ